MSNKPALIALAVGLVAVDILNRRSVLTAQKKIREDALDRVTKVLDMHVAILENRFGDLVDVSSFEELKQNVAFARILINNDLK